MLLGVMLMLPGCTTYYRMDVSVRTTKTDMPIDNVAVQTEYVPAPWYWPFDPKQDKAVTNPSGHTLIIVADYSRGTHLKIAGTPFKLESRNFELGVRLYSPRFIATVTPLGKSDPPTEEPTYASSTDILPPSR